MTTSGNEASERYRARMKAEGRKLTTVWLRPEHVAQLKALAKIKGSNTVVVEGLLEGLAQSVKAANDRKGAFETLIKPISEKTFTVTAYPPPKRRKRPIDFAIEDMKEGQTSHEKPKRGRPRKASLIQHEGAWTNVTPAEPKRIPVKAIGFDMQGKPIFPKGAK